jgi:hypothetical protein
MRGMFRSCGESFNRRRLNQLVDCRAGLYYHQICVYCLREQIQSDIGGNRIFTADCEGHPESRSRLGLTFENVCVRSKLTENTYTPS